MSDNPTPERDAQGGMRALVIPAEGEAYVTYLGGGDADQLRQMQEIVGGYIEAVASTFGVVGWCDEEGKFKGYKWNLAAQAILIDAGLIPGDRLMGTWLFTGEDGPEIAPLTNAHLTEIHRRLTAVLRGAQEEGGG